ncbi:hypothetical protein [Accumulibacter sp.]|uniref:hypothetical protein n=1 Tax=Accumulibacter sp. TaxID=2053492 RepID=UPI0025D339B3|nr:hypothetical protein [Accumulibacter sp.]MCM8595385.1 hypothetical protein [Accumulibacter sp.]MCM8626434.1 hypothetical protein [Accumulibacter sp.]MDS4049532.1 hypothetical protein [Accumulibacter sp.]
MPDVTALREAFFAGGADVTGRAFNGRAAIPVACDNWQTSEEDVPIHEQAIASVAESLGG